ncbi:hypothetical protein [Neptuniibacter sp.]|uniref:hypothetical protein n=1 Tax=Neptuniibacter sp. TaxID=1962643 RepID=UPI002603D265|nr:hypothetical protein [Neptuniibacter sp.]MCP4595040.1 hypothetical protein [Neptuniibacter sp.]
MKLHHLASFFLLSATSGAAMADLKTESTTQQVTPPAITVEEIPQKPRFFDQLDQDKDGKVSPQEAQVSPALVKGFKKIDANNDGFLSVEEFSKLQLERQVERKVETTQTKTFIAMASLHTL